MRSTENDYGSKGNYTAAADNPAPPMTENVMERMGYFNQSVSETLQVAHNIKGRLFGQAQEAEGAGRPQPVANGFVEQFNERSGELGSQLQRLDSLLREINSRL